MLVLLALIVATTCAAPDGSGLWSENAASGQSDTAADSEATEDDGFVTVETDSGITVTSDEAFPSSSELAGMEREIEAIKEAGYEAGATLTSEEAETERYPYTTPAELAAVWEKTCQFGTSDSEGADGLSG